MTTRRSEVDVVGTQTTQLTAHSPVVHPELGADRKRLCCMLVVTFVGSFHVLLLVLSLPGNIWWLSILRAVE